MKPIESKENKKDTMTLRVAHRVEEGKKHVEKAELKTRNLETIKYVERKLMDKGLQRMERHPADGLPLKHDPKHGHGGKYTWEGPDPEAENELEAAPPALDEKDPNYVDEGEDEKVVVEGQDGGVVVVGEVEVAKVAEEGVARVEVDPRLNVGTN